MTLANLITFFSPAYFFYPFPGYQFDFQTPLLVVFGLLILTGIVFAYLAKKGKKRPTRALFQMVTAWGLWGGIVGLILVFMRNQGIPYFSMRALLFFWLVALIVWGVGVMIAGQRSYKKALAQYLDAERKKKWMK